MKNKEQFWFFWGGPFSQWEPSIIMLDSLKFPTAEHYMMYKKAIFFEDYQIAQRVLDTPHPWKAKRLGRKVKDFNQKKWLTVAKQIVYDGNYAKFTQNSKLRKQLMNTGDLTLVEASKYDKIWGIGLEEHDPKALNRDTWEGQNLLGEIITAVREKLKFEVII